MELGKTRELKFTVPGKPKSKRTGKISTRGRFARLIKNPETAMFENLVAMSYKSQYVGLTPTEKPLRIEIKAFFNPVKNISKKKLNMLMGDDYPYCKKPDCSNITKAVEDGLNTVAYRDDSQIIECVCKKFYSLNERTEVTLIVYDELEVI